MTNASSRRVTFDPFVTEVTIMSIDDYTYDEISAAWYDEEEMDKISLRCGKILQLMEGPGGIMKGKKKYCMRGLEGHTEDGYMAKHKARSAAAMAVLTEQLKQASGRSIAEAYRKQTIISQKKAKRMGNFDRKAANAIYSKRSDSENAATSCSALLQTPTQCLSRCRSDAVDPPHPLKYKKNR